MSVPTMLAFPKSALINHGIRFTNHIHYQLSPEVLTTQTISRGEGRLNDTGALVIRTGEFTGRSPRDKFTVKDEITAGSVHWNEFNIPLESKYFDIIYKKVIEHLDKQPELWVRDCYACADRNPARVFPTARRYGAAA